MTSTCKVTLRAARKEDSPILAQLDSIASGGVIDYLFRDLVPGLTPVDIIAHSLESNLPPFSYVNAVVAEIESEITGMVLSYPSEMHKITKEMKDFFPPERLEYMADFYAAKVENSWYIDAIGVFEEHRRNGIGGMLIESVEERARKNGFDTLSLIAFADNAPALALYKSHGFEVVSNVRLEPNEYILYEGGGLLLRSRLV